MSFLQTLSAIDLKNNNRAFIITPTKLSKFEVETTIFSPRYLIFMWKSVFVKTFAFHLSQTFRLFIHFYTMIYFFFNDLLLLYFKLYTTKNVEWLSNKKYIIFNVAWQKETLRNNLADRLVDVYVFLQPMLTKIRVLTIHLMPRLVLHFVILDFELHDSDEFSSIRFSTKSLLRC